MNNITQYGTILSALGCILEYDSNNARLEVFSRPPGKEQIVDKALEDIDKFDDCANYVDGASALCLADYIDGLKNPLDMTTRERVLQTLGIKNNSKFIYQVLSLQKNNRSWHFSASANMCTHFGDVCTHRGIHPDPERKGRRSSRLPEDYHTQNSRGVINREQLVTPAVEKMFQSIPEVNLTSDKVLTSSDFDLKLLKKLGIEDKLRLITELQESVA